MSVLAVVAGVVLVFVAVFSPDPPLTYAWAAGIPLALAGLAGEVRLSRRQRRRPLPRNLRIRVDDVRGYERGMMVEYDGRPLEIVAVDRLEDEIYVRDNR